MGHGRGCRLGYAPKLSRSGAIPPVSLPSASPLPRWGCSRAPIWPKDPPSREAKRSFTPRFAAPWLSSKGGAELQVDVADEPKGAKDKKGNTQMRDTCIASAKHDDTRARFLISKYNGYERAKHAKTAVMALDVLTYGLSDTHNKPTVQRQFNIEIGLVGDEQEFEALGTHGLVLDISAGYIFSGRPNPQTQAPSTPPDTLPNSPTFNSLFTAPLKADFSQNFDETADRRESQHNNNKQS